MPNYDQHLQCAVDNLDRLRHLNEHCPTEFRWQTVLAHYAALHVIHSFLATGNKMGVHPESHSDLKIAIGKQTRYKWAILPDDVYNKYWKLDNNSRKARYHADVLYKESHFLQSIEYLNTVIEWHNIKFKGAIKPLVLKCSDKKDVRKHTHIDVIQRLIEA